MKIVNLNYNGTLRLDGPFFIAGYHSNGLVRELVDKVPSVTTIIRRDGHFLSGLTRTGKLYYITPTGSVFESNYTTDSHEAKVYSKLVNKLPRNYKGAEV